VEMREIPESTASLVLGFGTFIGVVGSLYGGYSGDRIGAKKTLSLAITGSVISLMFLGSTSQFYLLAALYVVYAFFSASVWSPTNALVADITPREKRGFSFSIYFFAEGLVFSMAPAIAAAMIGMAHIWYIFPFSIAFQIAGLVILQLLSTQTP
jgi:maltose/moltooligosaccharide transporter